MDDREARLDRLLGKIGRGEPLAPDEARFLDEEAAIRSLPPIGRAAGAPAGEGGFTDGDVAPRDPDPPPGRRRGSSFPPHDR